MGLSELRSFIFVASSMAVVYLISKNRGDVRWKFLLSALSLQFFFAFLLLKIPYVDQILLGANEVVGVLESVTLRATQFLFGYLAGGELPFDLKNEGANFIVAFRVLPLIIFISALSSVLFKIGLLPWIIERFSRLFSRIFNLNGVVSFASAASIFLGTIEAPLVVKPYLNKLDKAELLAIICVSMSTIAGTVMVLYASVLGNVVEGAVGHMITASVMSVPAALMYAHIYLPTPSKVAVETFSFKSESGSLLESFIQGTIDGLHMVLQIVAIIIALFATIYLLDHILQLVQPNLTLRALLGAALQPVVWLMGVSWEDVQIAGELMATKVVLNEFVGYLQMSSSTLAADSKMLMTYAMCGFANFASAGIIVGGLSILIPDRKNELGPMALISILIGNLATMTTAAIVNFII